MKILICTQAVDKNHPVLGFFLGWLKEFAKRFDEVHVICLEEGEYELPQNVHIYSLGKETHQNKFLYVLRFYWYFWRIFFNVKVDFVFFHMGAVYNILAAPFFVFRKIQGTKFYWWKAHGHINMIGRIASLFVEKIYTSTESGYSIDSPKRVVVGQAIDTERFIPPHEPENNVIRLMTTGRISPIKCYEVLVDAFIELRKRGLPVTLTVYGNSATTKDKAYEENLKERLKNENINPDQVFVGPVPHAELPQRRAYADYFVHASKTGSMDKNVLDAAVSQVIPVSSAAVYLDFFEGFSDILAYPEGDAIALADRIEVLESQSEEFREKIRHTLKQRVVDNHSLSTFVSRLIEN